MRIFCTRPLRAAAAVAPGTSEVGIRVFVRSRSSIRSVPRLVSVCLLVVVAGCGGSTPSANPAAHHGRQGAGTPSTSPSGSSTSTSTTAITQLSFSVIAGTYVAGTSDGGELYVRFDGASRFSGPDSVACPTCSTASVPLAHLDFSLTSLSSTGRGMYVATGKIAAESDPGWAAELGTGPAGVGPVGSAVSINVSSSGQLTASFLPPNDTLTRSTSN
jgi:hypothetical protein